MSLEDDVKLQIDDDGLEIEDESEISEPFDPNQIRIDRRHITLDLLLARIQHDELDLAPDFQREAGIWKPVAKSRLIESLLVRIPLPAFYVDGSDLDKWVVIDGLQRLTTLKQFVLDKELRLQGLEFLTQFEGKIYDDLPRSYQRRIAETQVTVYLIEKGTPPTVKFNIFKRINTGGVPLSMQEIRHALNQGKSTHLLKELASVPEFKEVIGTGVKDDRMAARELILRFFAFTLTSYKDFKGKEWDTFLDETMKAINQMPDSEIEMLKSKFKLTMQAAKLVFEEKAFRKQYDLNHSRRPVNKALFDIWSVNLNQLTDAQISVLESRKVILKEKFMQLMNSRDFDKAISQGTADISKVRLRFSAIERIIEETLA